MTDWRSPDIWDFNRYRHNPAPTASPGVGGDQGGAGGEVNPFVKEAPPSLDPFEVAARAFEPKLSFLNDPHKWGIHKLGEFFWSKQVEILTSLAQNRYTAVKSCHDAGKSFIAARAAVAWLDQYDPGEAFIVSTAPTSAQVSAILWREIQKAHKKGGFQGTITTAGYPQWKIGGELVGYGRKPADYSQSAFQGIHARYVLVIIDEACGITPELFNSVDALVTNANARVLAIGNPDDPTSHFASICKPHSGWHVIQIDGLRTPNFTRDAVEWMDCPHCAQLGRTKPLLAQLFEEENIPYTTEHIPEGIREMLLSPLWVEERLHRWVGNPTDTSTLSEQASQSSLFTAKVRGLFPESSSEGIIPLGWVEAAMTRHDDWIDRGRPKPHTHDIDRDVIGADIADEGEDATVIAMRHGWIVTDIRKHRSADVMESTGYIKAAYTGTPGSRVIVDSIGVGAGVLSRLREQKVPVSGFVASGSAKGLKDRTGEFQFRNLRAAAWWRMRELLDPSQPGGSQVLLPRSETLLADLTTPKWDLGSSATITIEPKKDIRKRLSRSTDEGDAVVMSFWQGRGTVVSDSQDVLSWYAESDGSVLSWGVDEMVGQDEW